jgi:hypothetical protein
MMTLNFFAHLAQRAFYFTIIESSRTAWLCAFSEGEGAPWRIYPVDSLFRGHYEVEPITDLASLPTTLKVALTDYLSGELWQLNPTPYPPKRTPFNVIYDNRYYELSAAGVEAFEDLGAEVTGGEISRTAATLAVLRGEGVTGLPEPESCGPDLLGSLVGLTSAAGIFAEKINSGDLVKPVGGDWSKVGGYNAHLQAQLADARKAVLKMLDAKIKTPAPTATLGEFSSRATDS